MADLTMPAGYRLEKGFLWPAEDVECAKAVFRTTDDADAAVGLCQRREIAVQAGGNMGVWPIHLAKSFARVVTFEPDPVNYRALVWNTASVPNVLALPCALSDRDGDWCDLDREPGNAGAHQVKAGRQAPMMTLDGLCLPGCDLIYLDVEGFELRALKGAVATIRAYRPVIAFEDKGLSARYGTPQGAVERWLSDLFDYQVHSRPRRDVIMVP